MELGRWAQRRQRDAPAVRKTTETKLHVRSARAPTISPVCAGWRGVWEWGAVRARHRAWKLTGLQGRVVGVQVTGPVRAALLYDGRLRCVALYTRRGTAGSWGRWRRQDVVWNGVASRTPREGA